MLKNKKHHKSINLNFQDSSGYYLSLYHYHLRYKKNIVYQRYPEIRLDNRASRKTPFATIIKKIDEFKNDFKIEEKQNNSTIKSKPTTAQ